jgi:arsenate reductase
MNSKPIVLILCTGNSCRSQMAEGFLRKYHGDRYDVHSAGVAPKDHVHPLAVQVMNEVGVDISGHKPKPLDQYLGFTPVRHLIIVCDKAGESCPRVWPGTYSRSYMPFDDPDQLQGPDAERGEGFRRIRNEISDAMRAWQPEVPR